jgi:hypothetical protein
MDAVGFDPAGAILPRKLSGEPTERVAYGAPSAGEEAGIPREGAGFTGGAGSVTCFPLSPAARENLPRLADEVGEVNRKDHVERQPESAARATNASSPGKSLWLAPGTSTYSTLSPAAASARPISTGTTSSRLP